MPTHLDEARFVGQKPNAHIGLGDWPQVIRGTYDKENLTLRVGAIPTVLGEGLIHIPHGSDWPSIREAGLKAANLEA